MVNQDLNQNPITDETIDDVSKSTWRALAGEYKNWTIVVIIVTVLGLILELFSLDNGFSGTLIVFTLFIPFAFWGYIHGQMEHEFMKQFAAANGYEYSPSEGLDDKSGFIFQIGHSKSIYDSVTGVYQNCPIDLMNYRYTIGSGKNQVTYKQSIFEIDFRTPVPHIILKSHTILDSAAGLERVALEGDFGQRYDFFVQKGFELEALQVFTPDFMDKVENLWKIHGLEFVGTKLYVYAGVEINKRLQLQNLYAVVLALIGNLDGLLTKMKSDIAAVSETLH